ncbi:ATP-dependent DNA ligase [Pyrodictium occultum]|uniref:ATP-dependent DNA ligase n=1 Tax=Pyrodictium occultum TaxID=2309 RepID=A0A0V8RU78_PYROC|nr:RNA ligase [Pyrodictium occultum]KSW11615.1 ATP-dependent DNA ligase [Pyrodictium occultum]
MTWIHRPEPWMLDVVADALGLPRERVEELASRRTLRFREFRGLLYASLRRGVAGHHEGTAVVFGRGWWRVVPGYPPIQRMVLPSVALPRHFLDRVVVEEKLNGYNVRVVLVDDRILAVTRGGLICPYTTSRLERLMGDRLREMLRELGPEDHVAAGEVIGLENPYTRYFYPEAPRFGYFVFDIFRGGRPLPPRMRDEAAEKHGVPHVPVLGVLEKTDVEAFKRIVERLDREGREGVVVKDPDYRVPPLKYTTSSTNIGDIRLGMRFFMEEGWSFLFSRILREIFRVYEEGVEGPRLDAIALELGRAALQPAVETVKKVAGGYMVYEEFELEFAGRDELEEFMDYMQSLGVDVVLVEAREEGGVLRARMRKIKETWIRVRRILETGVSPID